VDENWAVRCISCVDGTAKCYGALEKDNAIARTVRDCSCTAAGL